LRLGYGHGDDEKDDGRPRGFMLPMIGACGIEVFKTARHNGFDIDTRKEAHGRWN
jgi:hypothetical protein